MIFGQSLVMPIIVAQTTEETEKSLLTEGLHSETGRVTY